MGFVWIELKSIKYYKRISARWECFMAAWVHKYIYNINVLCIKSRNGRFQLSISTVTKPFRCFCIFKIKSILAFWHRKWQQTARKHELMKTWYVDIERKTPHRLRFPQLPPSPPHTHLYTVIISSRFFCHLFFTLKFLLLFSSTDDF